MTVWEPRRARGVVLFSTGHGAWPTRYDALARYWTQAGFAVLAPLHVDSLRHPDRESFSREASFPERLADRKGAGAYAARRWPGTPVAAAGHSFGTLTALCLVGAMAEAGPFRLPQVRAALGYSTPGMIPGLVSASSYATVAVPSMIITGDRDLVPGLVTDWRDHLQPIETAPAGDKYGLVLPGADHELIGHENQAEFAVAARSGLTFLEAFGLGAASAAHSLRAAVDTPQSRWLRR